MAGNRILYTYALFFAVILFVLFRMKNVEMDYKITNTNREIEKVLLDNKELKAKKDRKNKTLAENRKARHDYFIIEVFEAGIELIGTEVKSIRMGKLNLKDSYADVKNDEIFLKNMHISPYEMGNIYNKDPLRDRKLLMHKEQIAKLGHLSSAEGYTLIPLSVYLKNGMVKVALAVAKGKKDYDKRDSLLERTVNREISRELKDRNR